MQSTTPYDGSARRYAAGAVCDIGALNCTPTTEAAELKLGEDDLDAITVRLKYESR